MQHLHLVTPIPIAGLRQMEQRSTPRCGPWRRSHAQWGRPPRWHRLQTI